MVYLLKINPPKQATKKGPPPNPHHSWYFKSQKSMENQQTSTVELLELLASEVDLFVCFSFRWFVPVSCGGRTGCEFQSQGSQAESLEC